MPSKNLTISIIIPVYNGERHIKKTLESIATQTVMPNEVLLIDNNCTDRTVKIAQEFDFVKIVKQKKQGLTHARNLGFDSAKSKILGRIDVDSRLEKEWVMKVVNAFDEDNSLKGVAGTANVPILPYVKSILGTLNMDIYFNMVEKYFMNTIMWGGNMALTKDAWLKVKKDVCLDDSLVHEDQDISMCLHKHGLKIQKRRDIRVSFYDESFRYLPKSYHYYEKLKNTLKLHKTTIARKHTAKHISVVSYFLSLPALVYASLSSLLTFPIDWIALNVFKAKNWFD